MKRLTTTLPMLLALVLPIEVFAQDEVPVQEELSFDEPTPAEVGSEPGEDPDGDAAEQGLETQTAASSTPGTMGLGISSTLAGAVGAEAEFWVGDKMLITALLGVSFFGPDADGAESTTALLLAGGGFYRLAGGEGTDFLVGGRLDIGIASGGNSSSQINLEVPARIEYRFSDAMSIHFETGLVLGMISEDGAVTAPFGPADSRVVQLGGGLFGGAGLTFYVL